MIINVLILLVGFWGLIKGADFFVDGSSDAAKNFKVPGVIIGLTIVALGTSAPELAVSTSAAIHGSNEISISNVIGSNIFNLLMVLGVCAAINPLPVDKMILKRDFPFSIITTILALFAIMGFRFIEPTQLLLMPTGDNIGKVYRWIGIALVVVFIIYICVLIHDAKHNQSDEEEIKLRPLWQCAGLILLGLILIIAGGEAVVDSAKSIARMAGMTETLIGLTIVAVGTSLPELVTSIVAARKGETGLAIGNVVGSNLFNLMFILGISSGIHPIDVNVASIVDFIFLVTITIITYIYARTSEKINKLEGILLIVIYVFYVIYAIKR